jgi:hypothetical protein
MIIFIVLYIISLILVYLSVRGQESFDKNESSPAFWMLFLFFLPIGNLIILIAVIDWVKLVNKFFKLK